MASKTKDTKKSPERSKKSPDKDSKKGSPGKDSKKGSPGKDNKKGSPGKDSKKNSPNKKKSPGKGEPEEPSPPKVPLPPKPYIQRDVLYWLRDQDPYLVSNECCYKKLFPWDYWDEEDIPENCQNIHDASCRIFKKHKTPDGRRQDLGAKLSPFMADNMLNIPRTTGIVNFHAIHFPKVVSGSRTDTVIFKPYTVSKSLAIVYQFVRDLGMPEEYFEMIQREIYKTLPFYREVEPCKEVHLVRDDRNRIGMVMNCFKGPFGPTVFVIYVVFRSPAHCCGIRYGDQILELENRHMGTRHVLDRLVEGPGPHVTIIIRQNPFRRDIRLQYSANSTELGFTTSHGCVVYVEEFSDAQKKGLEVDQQIIEIDNECVVGTTDGQIKRAVLFNAQMRRGNTVTLTTIPKHIFWGYYKTRVDFAEIRRKAMSKFVN